MIQVRPQEQFLFLRRAIASPRHLGSITPSSRFLVRTLLDLGDVGAATFIVELGPGTGPFTGELLRRMAPGARLLCIERDPLFARHLRDRWRDPRLTIVQGDAQHLRQFLQEYGFAAPQLVVSGLPFTSLPSPVRDGILETVARALAPGGKFLLYQYSHAVFPHIRRYFGSVTSRWEVRNVPPAACIVCLPPL